jgi:hypothetical protein
MKVIIEANEQYKDLLIEVADAIKAKITFEEKDFWTQLPDDIKNKVEESQEQYTQGKHTEFAIVKEILLARKHRE